jgi:hypothetical protein
MRKTIKNKTKLRRLIKESVDNTDSLDAIEFYDDFSWNTMSAQTWTKDHVYRCLICYMPTEWKWQNSIDANITITFKKIERYILMHLLQGEQKRILI